MPRVEAPDGTQIDFPDTMQDSDIEAAMGKLYPKPASTPTRFDRFVHGVTGGLGEPGGEDPIRQVANGITSSLGRTTQAWHDMFTGHPNVMTPAEMVPLVGPAAVDAGRMLATPGQRTEGAGASFSLLAPFAAHGVEMPNRPQLNLAEGDTPTPGVVPRLVSAAKTAGPDVGKGAAKVAGGAAIDYAIPGEARMGAILGTTPLIRSGVRQIGRGVQSGVHEFRGPSFGPELPPRTPATPAPGPVAPSTTSGVPRIGITPAERIQAMSQSGEGTLGTRAEMMRQLRLANQSGAGSAAKQAIIRRFESPEYRSRENVAPLVREGE